MSRSGALRSQVSVGVCVSGTFGLPQNRARTILFAARADVALPRYPRPTHRPQEVPISMMTIWMHRHLINTPSAAEAVRLAPPLTLHDAFSDLPSIEAPPPRAFNTNTQNWQAKATHAQPHRAVRYAGLTSGGAAVGPTCAFQRAARAACPAGELADHESYVLNQVRPRAHAHARAHAYAHARAHAHAPCAHMGIGIRTGCS